MSMPAITGATRLFAIVGDPIVQVRSPEVYTQQFASAGIDAVLVPMHVPAKRCEEIVPALMALGNLDGLLVTAPLKARVAAYADRLGPTASCIGAVNALRREPDGSWTGDMFDGEGFVRGLLAKGARVRGRRVLQFGAGGAGSAIACALANAGVQSIRIVNPDLRQTHALVAAMSKAFPECDVQPAEAVRGDIDMIVNASPVGMRPGDGLPGDLGAVTADTLIGDVVLSSSPTAFIQQALDRGCQWADGRDMHSGQIGAIMNFFVART
ncbi:shikimate 5-dehydrogenase [Caballeronia cordobensis]|uniref:Shikimate 5-dehydrogenase n=2 Tax=Caballeronia cordobensis TaxID=1353886 RepID=A0A158GDX5_CABCO|nr:shikimate 5-dehydrogenase [Caballeronia cordobensis]